MNSIIQRVALFCSLPAIIFGSPLCLAATSTDKHEFRDIKIIPDRNLEAEAQGQLRADANELAELLKIKPYVESLRQYKAAGKAKTTQLPKAMQHARLLCLWKIFIASQEVRKVVAMINYDLSTTRVNLDSLTNKKNMTANMINNANFLQGGVMGTIKQSLNLHGLHIPAQEVGITTFGTGILLAGSNLFVPSLWSRKINCAPNMLSHIFNQDFKPADASLSYLWKFMNSPVPGSESKLTRREILVRHWQDFEGININNRMHCAQLAAHPLSPEQCLKENICIISQRMDLLEDLKCHMEEFEASLYELHESIAVN
ncbi:MAG: hypothetical protein K2W82_07810 [Candidatus Obscuribacterales bacterium]|nr:hypothetical protein [Candidatus Obscuribacterales bacterium]